MDLTSPRSQTPDLPRGSLRKTQHEAPPAYAGAEGQLDDKAGPRPGPPGATPVSVAPSFKPRTFSCARSPRETNTTPGVPTSPYATYSHHGPPASPEHPPAYETPYYEQPPAAGVQQIGGFTGRMIMGTPGVAPPVPGGAVVPVGGGFPAADPYFVEPPAGYFVTAAAPYPTLPYSRTLPPGADTDEHAVHHRPDRPKHDSPRASPRRSLFSNGPPPPPYAQPPAAIEAGWEPVAASLVQPPHGYPPAQPVPAATAVAGRQRVLIASAPQQTVGEAAPGPGRLLQEKAELERHNQQLREQVVQAHSELRRAETQIAEMAGELARLRVQGATPSASGLASPALHSPPYGGHSLQPPSRFITGSPQHQHFSPRHAAAATAPATRAPADDFRDYRVPRKDTSPPTAPALGSAPTAEPAAAAPAPPVPPAPKPDERSPLLRSSTPAPYSAPPAPAQLPPPPSPARPPAARPDPLEQDVQRLRQEAKAYQAQLESARRDLRAKDGVIDSLEVENRTMSGSLHKLLNNVPTSSPERSFVPEKSTFHSPSKLTRDQLLPLSSYDDVQPVSSDVMHQYLDEQSALVSDGGMSPSSSPVHHGNAATRRQQYHSEDSDLPLAQRRWKWVTTKGEGIREHYPAMYQTRKQRQLVRHILASS